MTKTGPSARRLCALHLHACLRFCAGVFMALAWLAASAAQAQTAALGTTSLLVGPAAGTGSVALAATGAWTNTSSANWLTLSPANTNGGGSANVVFSFAANPGLTRSNTLTIAGQTLTVTQAGATYVAARPWTTLVPTNLNNPYGVAVDSAGNVYIADTDNSAIKKWSAANNVVTTLVSSNLGNLKYPIGIAVDGAGNVYIADTENNAIKKWSVTNNSVTNLVSSGLSYPYGVAVDGTGNVYIADSENNAIKKWSAANGAVTILVSSGLNFPSGVAVDATGNVYIADTDNSEIKKWSVANSNVTTLVSSGLSYPSDVAVDGAGNVYIADTDNSALKEWVAADSAVTNLVSSGLFYPFGVAVDSAGDVYAADTLDNAVKELPYAFVDTAAKTESAAAGADSLVVLPAAVNLLAPFFPTSGQSWLTINGAINGVVSFSFTANTTGAGRTAQITLLGQTILVTQDAPVPLVTTLYATNITFTNATLLASVNPQGAATTVYFAYGASANYGSTNVVSTVGSGTAALTVSNIVTGLLPGVTYHFEAIANSDEGMSLGGDVTFVTSLPADFLGTTALLVGSEAGTNSVALAVTSPTGAWTNTANANWLSLSAANQSGAGSTNVVFSYAANPGATRQGTLTIAGQTLTVTQAGSTYVAAQPVTTLVSNLNQPYGVAVDGAGNVYIADAGNNAIDKWTAASNTLTTLVSSGVDQPRGVAVDGVGNVYIADTGSNAIQEWAAANSNLTTLVSSNLNFPSGVAVDGAGNLYIADTDNSAIKKLLATNDSVTTLDSSGLFFPSGTAVDAAGNVYIADTGHNAIKEWIAANNTVTTLVSSNLNEPNGVAVDGSGNVYIADTGNKAIKMWSAARSNLTTLVSSGLASPAGVAVDGAGNVYIADAGSKSILELPYAFVIPASLHEGNAAGTDSLAVVLPATENLLGPFYPSTDASWLAISSITNGVVTFSFSSNAGLSRTNHIILLGQTISVTQTGPVFSLATTALLVGPGAGSNSVVLAVNPNFGAWTSAANTSWLSLSAANQSGTGSTNVVFSYEANAGATRSGTLTIAGQTMTVTQAGSNYGPVQLVATLASNLNEPYGLAVDGAGNVYMADSGNNAIEEWTVAGNTVIPLVSTNLNDPHGVAVDLTGNVYIANTGSNAIAEWTAASRTLTNLLTNGLNGPRGVAVDSAGNLYIADTGNNAIKKWTPASTNATTLVTGLNNPQSVAVDGAGNVYIADTGNNAIKKWTAASASVTTLVPDLNNPQSVAVDVSGNVYFADTFNNALKKWTAASGAVSILASTGLSFPAGVAVDGAGNVYLANTGGNTMEELPYAFVDTTNNFESDAAGHGSLPVVLPATANLSGPFTPATSQSWLSIGSVAGGVVSFSFGTNAGPSRTAYVIVLGQTNIVAQGTIGTPPNLNSVRLLPNGVLQFTFTNNPNATFTVLSSTNLSLPLSDWMVIGVATNVGSGQFQFTSPPTTNNAQLFFVVKSP